MSYRLPDEKAIERLLITLLNQDVAVVATSPVVDASRHGLFIDADGQPVARVSCPLGTAAALGCALSMIPPTGAVAMVEDGMLSTLAGGNFHEVVNLFSSLFMDDRSSHLKLAGVEGGSVPNILPDGDPTQTRSASFELDLDRYGRQSLTFAC